ncbi:hypothetical protein MADA3029_940176 [Vibrio nigripulchritudo MADA3029]|nr:hypothetical protein VIBNIMADA3021_1230174 [Vibrio nigripulchritudo MADA3021]CCN62284.1 hypothetical protein MADA3029_940176 [Vibrio nigripulchritudo MADA3029]
MNPRQIAQEKQGLQGHYAPQSSRRSHLQDPASSSLSFQGVWNEKPNLHGATV